MADELKTSSEKLNYLFSKINWGASFLDSKSIDAMNTYSKDIQNEKEQYAKEQQLKLLQDLVDCMNVVNADCYDLEADIKFRKKELEKELQVKP